MNEFQNVKINFRQIMRPSNILSSLGKKSGRVFLLASSNHTKPVLNTAQLTWKFSLF